MKESRVEFKINMVESISESDNDDVIDETSDEISATAAATVFVVDVSITPIGDNCIDID